MSLDRRAAELAEELEVEESAVKHDLENLVAYSVPVDEAIQSLRRKYGGNGKGDGGPSSRERRIEEITIDDRSVSTKGRVLTVGTRSIRYQGTDHVITEGTVADGTGTIDYTAWESFDFEAGDTIAIDNAGVREWEGDPELNLGEHTTVRILDESMPVPYEVGGERSLDAVAVGDRGLTVDGHIIEVERRTIDGRDGPTEILSGIIADSTARLPFTDWNPHPAIDEDVSLRFEDVYVREFRGVPSINLSEFTDVKPLSDPVTVPETAPRTTIGEAIASGPTFDVELVGSIVTIRDGSGLIKRCPECQRVIQRGECRQHGSVDGVSDLRIKGVVDDGTGTATAIVGTDLTASVFGGDVEAAETRAREAMDSGAVAEDIAAKLVGKQVRVRGALSIDEYGATIDATEFEQFTDAPERMAASVLEEVVR